MTGQDRGKYIFPNRNDIGKPMSEASINQVIKRIDYYEKATGHGSHHITSRVITQFGLKHSLLMLIRTAFEELITMSNIWMVYKQC